MRRSTDVRDWLSARTRDPLVRYGLALLGLQLVWRTSIALGSYFWQDDFRFLSDVHGGLTADVVLQRYNGHLMPGKYVSAWLISEAGTSFTAAAVTLVVGQAIAGALMLWVLAQLFPGRFVALVGYAAYLFTPLSLVASTWWSYGMEGLPMQVALLGTLGAYLTYRRTLRSRWVVTAVGSLAFGLFFYEKALLIPVLVLGVALLVLDPQSTMQTRLRHLRGELRFWIPLVLLAGAHTAYFVSVSSNSLTAAPDVDPLKFLSDAVASTLLPGLLGGPWTDSGALNTLLGAPSRGVVAVTACLWLLLIAFTVHRRRWVAVRAWSLGFGYVGVLLGLVLWQRADFANFLARDPRYILDAVPVLVIVSLAALTPVAGVTQSPEVTDDKIQTDAARRVHAAGGTPVRPFDIHPRAALIGVVSVVASAWVTTGITAPQLQHSYSRHYVAALAVSLAAEPDVVLVDAPAPPVDVLIRPLSEVVRAMGMAVRWDEPTTDLRIADGLGQLADVGVPDPDFARSGPEAGCGWRLRPADPELVLYPSQATETLRVLSLGYIGNVTTDVAITVDGRESLVAAEPGVGHLFLVTRGPVGRVSVDVRGPEDGLCITDLSLGAPWPVDQ